MDIQAMFDAMSDMSRETRSGYHLTLGMFVSVLESAAVYHVRTDQDGGIDKPHSYRGYYSDLAFEPTPEPTPAATVLPMVRHALGNIYYGYKGGEYPMGSETPLWLAHYGDCGLAIVGTHVEDGTLVLATKDVDGNG